MKIQGIRRGDQLLVGHTVVRVVKVREDGRVLVSVVATGRTLVARVRDLRPSRESSSVVVV